jgi:hypothetical protein
MKSTKPKVNRRSAGGVIAEGGTSANPRLHGRAGNREHIAGYLPNGLPIRESDFSGVQFSKRQLKLALEKLFGTAAAVGK